MNLPHCHLFMNYATLFVIIIASSHLITTSSSSSCHVAILSSYRCHLVTLSHCHCRHRRWDTLPTASATTTMSYYFSPSFGGAVVSSPTHSSGGGGGGMGGLSCMQHHGHAIIASPVPLTSHYLQHSLFYCPFIIYLLF